jgi:hypothetical protein
MIVVAVGIGRKAFIIKLFLPPLNLSDITSKYRIFAVHVTVMFQAVFYKEFLCICKACLHTKFHISRP